VTLCLRLEPALKFGMEIWSRVEEFLDARQRTASRRGAGLDSLVRAVEIIPGKRLDIWAENQVSMTLPDLELMLLSGAHSAAHNLENIGWCPSMSIFDTDGNAHHVRGTQFACREGRNLGNETSVSEAACSNFHGFEQAGKCATGADRFAQISASKDNRLAVGQVRRNNGHGNPQIFEAPRFKDLLYEVAEPVIAGEPQPGNSPAGDVPKTKSTAGGNDARQRGSACIRRTENAAHAGPSDMRDGNVILFENLQNAEMREATREAAA
jgi:hypothetical protein